VKQVEAGLATYKLDSSIIIAEAIKAKAFELAPIDAQIASLEVRRDRALARIAQYRGELGAVLRRTTERLIESNVVELEGRPVQKKTPRPQRAKNEVVEHNVVELDSIKTDKKQPAA
jgi:hypothetical protein